jgi:DNA-binding Lrp family transcriptional regulator
VAVARPKVRSRAGGAAVPLDETDKRLMNLLQSSFPLEREPFAAIAGEADIDVGEAKARTQRLLDERIIREITPIFDTRALGYSSMLVAAKVDSDNPHRAAAIINAHPGVSHNYLRTHEFNLWFTIATPPDSELGLEGTLDVLKRLTGAESIRQLPTLVLFKINMNLEMERGTDALAAQIDAAPPRELEAQPHDERDVGVIRALQGPMDVADRPYDAAAEEVGMSSDDFLAPPRGGDPVSPPGGVLGQRDGRVAGSRSRRPRGGTPDGRGARDLTLLPAPDLCRLAVQRVHDGSRPFEGGVRRDPRPDRGGPRAARGRSRGPVLID